MTRLPATDDLRTCGVVDHDDDCLCDVDISRVAHMKFDRAPRGLVAGDDDLTEQTLVDFYDNEVRYLDAEAEAVRIIDALYGERRRIDGSDRGRSDANAHMLEHVPGTDSIPNVWRLAQRPDMTAESIAAELGLSRSWVSKMIFAFGRNNVQCKHKWQVPAEVREAGLALDREYGPTKAVRLISHHYGYPPMHPSTILKWRDRYAAESRDEATAEVAA